MVLNDITNDKKPLKDNLDIIGHKDAFELIYKLVKEKSKLSKK